MKHYHYILCALCTILVSGSAYAATGSVIIGKSKITPIVATGSVSIPQLRLEKFFVDVCTKVGEGIPLVYKDIHINWRGVKSGTALYTSLQKCAYLGVLQPKGSITDFSFQPHGTFIYDFFLQKFAISLPADVASDTTIDTSYWDETIVPLIPSYTNAQKIIQASARGSNTSYESTILQSPFFPALNQAYASLKQNYHYLSGAADDQTLLYGAVQGLVESMHDRYTVYFPSESGSTFLQDIQGEYEGVGAYVDALDGKFTFVGIVPGSPAQEAGIQAGDHVVSVDDWKVPDTFILKEVIGKIKGPVGTKVTVGIERAGVILQITMERRKVSIPLLDIKKKNNDIIFTITSFGNGLDTKFIQSLTTYKQDIADAKNVIIDLRNNGGGYVDVVNNMMNYFVSSGNTLLQYELKDHREKVVSVGPSVSPFANKNIIILINKGTASASEILAGVIKDYYPSAKLVGENSFGKGSMQAFETLPNGASFKYTIALRYIGKSGTSIEKKGLKPDVEIIDNPKTSTDEVLDTVLSR